MTLHAPAVTRLAVALALALSTPLAAARGVPPGFEDLVEGQTEQLDIQLFGRSAGLSPVRVTLEHVQLEDPARVLQSLDLPAEAQAALLPALSQPLPRNSHLACRFGGASAGCGYIDPPEAPDEVRALYDEGEGAVRLFVARQWIPGKPAAERFHTVTANAENAFLHQQTLNLSGGRDYQSLSARGVGTLGLFDRGHLSAEWYHNQQRYRSHSDDDFQFDNVYYRHDLGPAHYLQAGRMDRRNLSSPQGGTFSFSMLPLDRFQGARLGTTQAYVDTDAAVQASPLTVLLARDARVDVFDGERLLQTFYLQAGINQIDTRNFPFGNYLVRMRIYEDGVLVRTEEAPFDKGGDWTNSQWQWFVQGGHRNERRSDAFDGERIAMAGVRVPLGRDAAMTAGAATFGGHRYGELRLDLRRVMATQEVRATFSGMRGSDGSNGQQHQLSYRRTASWNLYQQRMRGKACQFEAEARDQLGCTNALSGSMSLPLAGGNVYVGYTRRQTWRTGWHRPEFEQDPLFGLEPLLPPGPLEPRREPLLSRTWQASFSRSHRWQDFSVSTRVGVWRQNSTDSVRGSTERDRGIYVNLSLSRRHRSAAGDGQRRYAVDVRQPQHQRPAIDYSVGQSLRQELDTTVPRAVRRAARQQQRALQRFTGRPAAEWHRPHQRQPGALPAAWPQRDRLQRRTQFRLRAWSSRLLLERCQWRRRRPRRAGGRYRRRRPARRGRRTAGGRAAQATPADRRTPAAAAAGLSIATCRSAGRQHAGQHCRDPRDRRGRCTTDVPHARQADAHAGADRSDLHLHRPCPRPGWCAAGRRPHSQRAGARHQRQRRLRRRFPASRNDAVPAAGRPPAALPAAGARAPPGGAAGRCRALRAAGRGPAAGRDPPAGPRDPPAAGTRVDRRHAPDRCCRRYAMNRRWMFVLMLVSALVLVMPRAWGQWPPETHPADQGRDIVMSWDRSAVPGDVELWAPRTVLGFSHDLALKYGQIHVVCESASDPEFGRCETEGRPNIVLGESEIWIRMVEQRTGLRADVRVFGHVRRIFSGRVCSADFWDKDKRWLNAAFWFECSPGVEFPLGTGAELVLAQAELSRLVAGHWKAAMRLNIKADPAAAPVATATFNFDFTVTDYDAISIYFPTFDTIAPLVNLDLRYDPIQKVVGGRKQLDMCLYDGLGSQSEYLDVTVRDSGPRPPAGSDFSLWHRDGGSDASQRLDYRVHLDYGGHRLAMKHNVKQQLRGIDSAQLRLVMLPGISQPVYCVPTPLTLETPPTPIASQRPGLYEGELTVVLDVPTAKP